MAYAKGIAHTWAEIEVTIEEKPTETQINDIFDIMQESLQETIEGADTPEVEENNNRELIIESDEYILHMEYSINVEVEGDGYYHLAKTSGPPEDCYPADSDADFDLHDISTKAIKNYIKDYFIKYDPIKDLTLIEVDVSHGDLDVTEWEIEDDDRW